jgi:hypothetical protein
MLLFESFLQRMELPVTGNALYCRQLSAVGLHREQRA